MNIINLQIRKATKNDIDFLLDLRIKTMTEHLTNSHFPTDKESHLKRIHHSFDNANIINWYGQPIGLLKVAYEKEKIEIIQLQIHPDFQSRGFGKQILEIIIEESLLSQIPIFLSVLKTNPAQKLYFRAGFKIVEENEHSFIMQFSK